MTLVVAVANANFVVQVSDRRLTAAGAVVEEEESKTIYLESPTLQAAIGYTGFARIGRRRMSTALMGLITKSFAPAPRDPLAAFDRLSDHINRMLTSSELASYSPADRRLSVMITGFAFPDQGLWGPLQWLITNFQDWETELDSATAWPEVKQYFVDPIPGREPLTYVQRIGRSSHMPQDVADDVIRPLLVGGRTPHAVRDKIVELISEYAQADIGIGSQIDTIIIQPGKPPVRAYRSAVTTDTIHLGDAIRILPDGSEVTVDGARLSRVDGLAAVVPRVHESAPCPCGSGRKYGSCHGDRKPKRPASKDSH